MHMSAEDVGQALHLTGSSINRKLAGQTPWTVEEAHRVMECLDIPPEEMYFFFPKHGEDAEHVREQRIRGYLEDTNQALISRSALDTLIALVGSLDTHSTTSA